MLNRRQFLKLGAAAGAATLLPWPGISVGSYPRGVPRAFAAQSPQIPLPGSAIPQFIDAVPNLLDGDHLIVDGGTPIELEMKEHLANVLPANTVPGYAGTYVWSYLKPGQDSRASSRRRLRARLLSPRGAPDAYLLFPPGARVVSGAMAGRPVPVPPARVLGWYGGWRMVRCLTLPPSGVEVELVLEGKEPVEVQLVDQRPVLPSGGGRLAAARPAWAATFQEGDTTYVTRWLKL